MSTRDPAGEQQHAATSAFTAPPRLSGAIEYHPAPRDTPLPELLGGTVDGIFYENLYTREEREQIRRELRARARREMRRFSECFQAYLAEYTNPWDEDYGEYDVISSYDEDWEFESRRRIIAQQMGLDPATVSWYGLGKEYTKLMHMKSKARPTGSSTEAGETERAAIGYAPHMFSRAPRLDRDAKGKHLAIAVVAKRKEITGFCRS